MDIDLEITDCTEDAFAPKGKKPLTLKEVGVDRLLNRRILKWAAKGSYGTGGTGFLGIQLNKKSPYPKEWLVLALWGSHDWVLLDGIRLGSQVKITRIPGGPVFAVAARLLGPLNIIILPIITVMYLALQPFRPLWDGVWRKIVGARISEIDITENHSSIKIMKRSNLAVLEIPNPGPDLPKGNRWIIKANHLEAWKISESGKIYC